MFVLSLDVEYQHRDILSGLTLEDSVTAGEASLHKMEKTQDSQVWSLNMTAWKWELEGYLENKMEEDGFIEDLIILLVIVAVILVLIFILSVQISRSYFRSSATPGTSKTLNLPRENLPEYSDVVLNIDENRKEDPPTYSELFS